MAVYDDAVIVYDHPDWTFDHGRGLFALIVPTRREQIARTGLFRFYGIEVAGTLICRDGSWSLVYSPSDDELVAAEAYYRGGYQHAVSVDHMEELVADGFGDYL